MSLVDIIANQEIPISSKGYSITEVDSFLDSICDIIDSSKYYRFSTQRPNFTWENIYKVKFTVVPNGYDRNEVDSFLDWISVQLWKTVPYRKARSEASRLTKERIPDRKKKALFLTLFSAVILLVLVVGININQANNNQEEWQSNVTRADPSALIDIALAQSGSARKRTEKSSSDDSDGYHLTKSGLMVKDEGAYIYNGYSKATGSYSVKRIRCPNCGKDQDYRVTCFGCGYKLITIKQAPPVICPKCKTENLSNAGS